MTDSYEAGAAFYDDAYEENKKLVDRSFYVDLASSHGGPVLELGCGTGRITWPIAESGVDITGVDASPAMLEKANRYPADVRERLRTVRGVGSPSDHSRKAAVVRQNPGGTRCTPARRLRLATLPPTDGTF